MTAGRNANTQSGTQGRGGAQGRPADAGTIYEQAGSAVSGLAETASDLWDDVYDHGEEYLQQGRRAVGRLDGVTLAGLAAAGALGFAVAWMMFTGRSESGAERMHESQGKRARRREQGRQRHADHRGQRTHG